MPLSALLLDEYLQAIPPTTRQKGEKIYDQSTGRLVKSEADMEVLGRGPRSIRLFVPSDSGYYGYEVVVSWTKVKITARCECPAFEEYGPCKHIVAGIRYLQDHEELDAAPAPAARRLPPAQEAPVVFDKMTLRSGPGNVFRDIDYRLSYGYHAIKKEAAKIESTDFQPEKGIWDFVCRESAKRVVHPRIVYDGGEVFKLSCTCGPALYVCGHLFSAAAYLYEKGGSNYFAQFRDFSAEKARILTKLGLQPDEPAAADVQFYIDSWGRLAYEVPEWLWSPEKVDMNIASLQSRFGLAVNQPSSTDPAALSPGTFIPAVVFQTATGNLPFPFELVLVNTAGGKFSKLGTANEERWQEVKSVLPARVYKALLSISQSNLNRQLQSRSIYLQLPGSVKQMGPGQRVYDLLTDAYRNALRLLWPWLSGGGAPLYTTGETRFTQAAQTQPILLEPQPVTAGILVRPAGRFIEIRLQLRSAESDDFFEAEVQPVAGLLLRSGDVWYLPADDLTFRLMEQFPAGFVRIPAGFKKQLFGSLLPALRELTEVRMDPSLQLQTVRLSPEPSLHLAERGNKQLALMPQFSYAGTAFSYEPEPAPFISEDKNGNWQEIVRDAEAEAAFAESIRALHPDFGAAPGRSAFFLPFGEALRDSWYQKMLAGLAERGVPVTGMEALQHFRYNSHEAKVSISSREASGGIDWFDLLIEISFGDQQVSLKEVRKALLQGQAGVRLADGSIGLLPESFVQEYGTLLKLGTEKGGRLQVSKLHFTLIDALHETALSKDLRAEIAAKKEALRSIEDVRTAVVPASLRATLRPYQAAGYQWLQQLDQLGWGGCLADDMGLGKTLQTIAFLQHLQEQDGRRIHLVVCPTSLIYNWQAELEKFAPSLRYHIHYGADRVWNPEALAETDVVITSYGLLRADLERLMSLPWYCVVLDESQAIKNPAAQTTKAVQLLPAKTRICLSGTPLQNNTFDLYAQFQFLNPGLLGSQDFFRTEFATPIDKHGEEGARSALRNLLAPFMLRRTKEQVAPELPDKTEAVLWCEMEPAQRAVYEEYRNFYRDSLLKRIDAEGMAGASIYVLEALLRLRQLCDHPALVKNEAIKTAASSKLDELRREIRENAGGRKVLVFSQFTEMLALIVKAFEEDGIACAYLDGQTPAAKRKAAVERFQTDPSVQVFLISLKAGGVGLNLTAAEYVYIVDPWWNPAAEAQAIDRTHRIGQTNKIVAYRMICKDTVEEKVLQLQQRKKALAEGLVTEDAGFVKKLTREDVAFLLEG